MGFILTLASGLMLAVGWLAYQAYAVTDNGSSTPQSIENYSAIGTVGGISTSTDVISFSDAVTSDKGEGIGFSFDLSSADNIESADYIPLSIGDISVGDKVIVQGLKTGNIVTISRVIDLSWNGKVTASSTATSTVDLTASTTDTLASTSGVIASTTLDDASSTASSTPDEASSTDSFASSTDDTASSTDAGASPTISTSTEETASSTVDVSASTTDETPVQSPATTTDSSIDPQPAESAPPSIPGTDSSSTSP